MAVWDWLDLKLKNLIAKRICSELRCKLTMNLKYFIVISRLAVSNRIQLMSISLNLIRLSLTKIHWRLNISMPKTKIFYIHWRSDKSNFPKTARLGQIPWFRQLCVRQLIRCVFHNTHEMAKLWILPQLHLYTWFFIFCWIIYCAWSFRLILLLSRCARKSQTNAPTIPTEIAIAIYNWNFNRNRA